jgi:hypothetical protein
MGKAVYLRGEFYVFGGETLDDPDADVSGVYDRVDVYDPSARSWRAEARMLHARHGIFPVTYQGHVFLAGGGTTSADSGSTVFDTFTPSRKSRTARRARAPPLTRGLCNFLDNARLEGTGPHRPGDPSLLARGGCTSRRARRALEKSRARPSP